MGLPSEAARALAALMPTVREPMRPGPAHTATASTSPRSAPAASRAASRVGMKDSRWAREAISGMMPPKRAYSSMEVAVTSARSSRPRTSATPVSSQVDSMPRIKGSLTSVQPSAPTAGKDRDNAGAPDGRPVARHPTVSASSLPRSTEIGRPPYRDLFGDTRPGPRLPGETEHQRTFVIRTYLSPISLSFTFRRVGERYVRVGKARSRHQLPSALADDQDTARDANRHRTHGAC